MSHPNARALLLDPVFLASVTILAVNDHILKPTFGNWVTGKLSDITGLLALTLFAVALAPRWRIFSSVIIVVTFVWWKSPASSTLIDTWNTLGPWQIGRTHDYSDLIAIPAVFAALLYARKHQGTDTSLTAPIHRKAIVAVAVLSLVVFVATSYRSNVPYSLSFSYAGTQDQLISSLEAASISVSEGEETNQLELWIPSDFCFESVYASVELQPTGDVTILHLREITHHCPQRRHENRLLLEIFMNRVVAPLGLRPSANHAVPPDAGTLYHYS